MQRNQELSAARDDLVVAALGYGRNLRTAMIDPANKHLWDSAHKKLIVAITRVEEIQKAKASADN